MSSIATQKFNDFRGEVDSHQPGLRGHSAADPRDTASVAECGTSRPKAGPAAAAFSVVVKDMNQLSLTWVCRSTPSSRCSTAS